MRPPVQLMHSLARARARVFQTTEPQPLGVSPSLRTGAKYLRQRLVGPSMLNYYPALTDLRPISKTLYGKGGLLEGTTWYAPDGSQRSGVIAEKELQRLKDVERQKRFGKGPPPKGKGRRAQMKSKGKKR